MKLDRQLILIGACWLFFSVQSEGFTSAVWRQKIPAIGIAPGPIETVFAVIEQESAKVDPQGRGIRIVSLFWPKGEMPRLERRIEAKDISVIDLLRLCLPAEYYFTITHDVATIASWQSRFLVAGLEGRCTDAVTGRPIVALSVIGGELEPTLVVRSDGHYVCLIPIRVNFLVNSDIIVTDFSLFSAKQAIRISAPGYKPFECSVDAFGTPGTVESNRRFDIALEPEAEGNRIPVPHLTNSTFTVRN